MVDFNKSILPNSHAITPVGIENIDTIERKIPIVVVLRLNFLSNTYMIEAIHSAGK